MLTSTAYVGGLIAVRSVFDRPTNAYQVIGEFASPTRGKS